MLSVVYLKKKKYTYLYKQKKNLIINLKQAKRKYIDAYIINIQLINL